jgi:hypothetical protein
MITEATMTETKTTRMIIPFVHMVSASLRSGFVSAQIEPLPRLQPAQLVITLRRRFLKVPFKDSYIYK